MKQLELSAAATPLNPTSAPRAGFFPAAAVFATGLLVAWLLPLSRMLMFPYELLAARDGAQQLHHLLTHEQALRLAFLQWGSATVVFGALAKREQPVLLAPLTLAAFMFVALAMHATVAWLGMGFYRDLWH
jgi:hypothetical protein